VNSLMRKAGLPDGIFSDQKSLRVNFGGPCNGRCEYILWTFGLHILRPFDIFCGHLVYFLVIWYILLENCTKKNLATLEERRG
jgi:hypothetical protein